MQSRAHIRSSIVFLRSSSSCLHIFPRIPFPSIFPSIFPSVTCFRTFPRQDVTYMNQT